MSSMLSLTGLRAFESAARLLSFTSAAAELGVTASAVSHQIATLETALSVRLFHRTPRAITLTEQGLILQPFISEAFEKIAQGTELVAPHSQLPVRRRLQIYVTVASRWLIPRLENCRETLPNLDLDLDSTVMDWDFDPNRADMGFVYAVNPKRDAIEYHQILRAELVYVCTKKLAKGISRREGLSSLPRIEVPQSRMDWDVWCEHNRIRLTLPVAMQFDSMLLAIEAALSGLGVLVIPEFLVRDYLRSGRLVSPSMGKRVPQVGSWYLAYPTARKFDKAILGFERWLNQQSHPEMIRGQE